MANSEQNTSYEGGFFKRLFQDFDEEQALKNLDKRVQERSYFNKNKGIKNTLLALSYVLNFVSALSASYLIYWLANWLTGYAILGYILAGVFLFFLEKLKRKSSNEFFQVLFFKKEFDYGWFFLSLLCFALSISSTFFGTNQGTKDFAPQSPTLLADTSEVSIKNKIAELEMENDSLETQKDRTGTTYFPLQRIMESNKKMVVALQERLTQKEKNREKKNNKTNIRHAIETNLTASVLAWILVFLELIFEASIAYIWYYYYRSHVEWKQLKNTQFQQHQNTMLSSPLNGIEAQEPPPFDPTLNQANMATNTHTEIKGFRSPKNNNHGYTLNDSKKTPVRACTRLYTENITEDKYTIAHEYLKGGKKIIARYTEPQVRARLNQWIRGLNEANQKEMAEEIIQNREAWVRYWGFRLKELQKKTG